LGLRERFSIFGYFDLFYEINIGVRRELGVFTPQNYNWDHVEFEKTKTIEFGFVNEFGFGLSIPIYEHNHIETYIGICSGKRAGFSVNDKWGDKDHPARGGNNPRFIRCISLRREF